MFQTAPTGATAGGQQGDLWCIDVDVHERYRSARDLLPYLDEKWHHYITECKYNAVRNMPYVRLSGGGDRLDARPADHSPAGSDLDLLRRQLFDEARVSIAILTGALDVYFGGAEVQTDFYVHLASAYNAWLAENWLAKDHRLRGSIQIAPQDPEAAVAEIEKWAGHPQMIQVLLPVITHDTYGRRYYFPIFAAAERHGLPIALHQCWATETSVGWPQYYVEWHSNVSQAFMSQLSSLIFGGVLERFNKLKVALIEGGFAWVPSLMWSLDQNFRYLRHEVPWLKRLPSEYIRDHCKAATQPMIEPEKPEHLEQIVDMIGDDRFLMFSTDYPHWDYDDPIQALRCVRDPGLRRKILVDNAREFYGL